MRRLGQRAARWHQCCVPKPLLSIRRCDLPVVLSVQTLPRRYATNGSDGGDRIRIYDQVVGDSKKRVRVDGEKQLDGETARAKAELDQLDEELEQMRRGPLDANDEFMRSLPEDQRKELLEALDQLGILEDFKNPLDVDQYDEGVDEMIEDAGKEMENEDEDEAEEDGGEQDDEEASEVAMPSVTLEISPKHRAYVDRFNALLKAVTMNGRDNKKSILLWNIYIRCKQNVPSFLFSIPGNAWESLWKSQSETVSNLTTLAKDMESLGKPLSGSQWLAYMEGLHLDGRTEEALDKWKSHEGLFGSRGDLVDQYWELGTRFYAALERPEEGQKAALSYLKKHRAGDPRILLPIISSWSRSKNGDSAEKAWTLYLQLKAYLSEALDETDYELVSTAFLNTGRSDMALAVFKDMILSQGRSPHDSISVYKKAMGFVGDLQASSVTEKEVNRVSIAALTTLPRSMQNKFFYGSWIKKLIGLDEVNAAAAVVELMYERGVKPDPKVLNGIIGAWLRRNDNTSRERAERMGWAMVQERINFVTRRQTRPFAKFHGDLVQSPKLAPEKFAKELQIPAFLQRTVPPATIETFSILLLHYTRRSRDNLVNYLLDSMNVAQVPPNSFIMNHILYSDLRKHDLTAAWGKYTNLSKTVYPDLETYACLWDCGKVQYSPSNAAKSSSFPQATTLYREMNDWFQSLKPQQQSNARSEMSADLYDQIIRCFTLSKDLKGTLVALHGLAQLFHFYPSPDTSRLIVLQLSRMLPQEPGTHITLSSRRRRMSGNPNSKAQIARVTAVLETLTERRKSSLLDEGADLAGLPEKEQGVFQLACLSELLVIIMRRISTPDSNLENEVEQVAKWMGVAGVDLKDIEAVDTFADVKDIEARVRKIQEARERTF